MAADLPSRWTAAVSELVSTVVDLALPGACVGCGTARVPLRFGVCAGCVRALEQLRPHRTAPVSAPVGLPLCVTTGAYADPLRALLLAYKERGRHRLAGPLGNLLAAAVAEAAVAAGGRPEVPLLLAPVPSTTRAVRQRHGDHMARLAAQAVRRLRRAGWQAELARPLRALPRPDSAVLTPAARAAVAARSLRSRPGRIADLRRRAARGGMLVVVDDIITTGATLSAVSRRLADEGVAVAGAAVLAATRLRRGAA